MAINFQRLKLHLAAGYSMFPTKTQRIFLRLLVAVSLDDPSRQPPSSLPCLQNDKAIKIGGHQAST